MIGNSISIKSPDEDKVTCSISISMVGMGVVGGLPLPLQGGHKLTTYTTPF